MVWLHHSVCSLGGTKGLGGLEFLSKPFRMSLALKSVRATASPSYHCLVLDFSLDNDG